MSKHLGRLEALSDKDVPKASNTSAESPRILFTTYKRRCAVTFSNARHTLPIEDEGVFYQTALDMQSVLIFTNTKKFPIIRFA